MKRGVFILGLALLLLAPLVFAADPPLPPSQEETEESFTSPTITSLDDEPTSVLNLEILESLVQTQQQEIDALQESLSHSSSGIPTWVYVAAGLAIFQFFLLLFLFLKQLATPDPAMAQLHSYVNQCRLQKYTREQVSAALKKSGYSDEMISQALAHY